MNSRIRLEIWNVLNEFFVSKNEGVPLSFQRADIIDIRPIIRIRMKYQRVSVTEPLNPADLRGLSIAKPDRYAKIALFGILTELFTSKA